MQNQKFNNDDGLYELLNVNDNFEEEINTSRTEDLIFNSNPIDWHRKIYFQNQHLTNSHLNGNNSLVILPSNGHSSYTIESALESNSNCNLPIPCEKNSLTVDDHISIDLTPRSQFFNEKARQNIDKLLPQICKSQLNLTNDLNQQCLTNYIVCPECKIKNASDLDWCLSCGLFLIKQKKPNSFIENQPKNLISNDNKSIINNFPNSIIKNKENYSRCFENLDDFDRIYKRTYEISDNLDNGLTKSSNTNHILDNTGKSSKNGCLNEDIKLNLSELNHSISENNLQLSNVDLDIDLCEPGMNKLIDSHISLKLPTIPPLHFASLDTNRENRPLANKEASMYKEDTKENESKPNRKWGSSSMAWVEMPNNLLKKKPAKYYRNKLNSCTNKMGLHIFPSKIDADLIGLWHDTIADSGRPRDVNGFENNDTGDHGCDVKIDRNISYTDEDIDDHVSVEVDNHNNCNISGLVSLAVARNTSPVSNWQCLPAEIWIQVMLYLPHCDLSRLQQTCRRFYSIGLDSQLWRCVTLYRHNSLTDVDIINIARKMPKELHFKNCFGTSITFNGLKEMFHICGCGVEKISFISCSKGALEGDQFLVLSAAFCPNVTHINASYLMNLQDSTLISMTEGFNKIVSLNLMGAHAISNESIKSLIKNHRSSLTSLDLYGCFKLNSGTLRILEECLNLKSLALGSINKLKRAAMVDLLRKLSQLTNLDLRGTMNLIDDPLLAQICLLCPNLQQIILTNSCLVGNQGLHSLANSNVSKTLKVLDICGCSRITDKGVEAILKNCQSLEDLDISCTGITGRITKLFKTYPPPSLKCLRVNNNKLISDTELASIVKSSKKLSTVYMCGITSIETWRSLEATFQHILFKHE